MNTTLAVHHLSKTFGGGRTWTGKAQPSIHAVRDISFNVARGETLGIVGESGCGKSTVARMLVGLLAPSSGDIEIEGKSVSEQKLSPAEFGQMIQYVFQDPISSLNPRKSIRQILEAPLIHLRDLEAPARKARLGELLDAVQLRSEALDRYPHEFSGGQAQRIGIARALAAEPGILVLDEPVSALDVSVQAQILNLLADLQETLDLTYIFISHDLAVIEAVSDRIAVLYFGRMVELAPAKRLFAMPQHPYTELLMRSAPEGGRPLAQPRIIAQDLPDPLDPPKGCAFAPRCPYAEPDCRRDMPKLEQVSARHEVACLHPLSG
ncbi:MAG: ABC transporter ATP-binding protein [Geminicoccaceae bacterium]